MKGILTLLVLVSLAATAEDISQCKQGWNEYQRGSYENAINLFNSCIKTGELSQATLAQTYRNMGLVANGSNRSAEALKFYDKAIALNPKEIWYDYVNKGNAYSHLGQYDRAIESYQKAFDAKPHFNEAYYNLGLVYDRKGDVATAIKNYKLAYEYGLNTPNLMERIGHHGIKLGVVDALTQVSENQSRTNQGHTSLKS